MSVLPSPSNTSAPQSKGYEANLDDLLLRFAVGPGRQLNINTAPLQAQAIQTSETPEDFQQEFGQIFSRTDFAGGSGLDKHIKEMQVLMIFRGIGIVKVLMYLVVKK